MPWWILLHGHGRMISRWPDTLSHVIVRLGLMSIRRVLHARRRKQLGVCRVPTSRCCGGRGLPHMLADYHVWLFDVLVVSSEYPVKRRTSRQWRLQQHRLHVCLWPKEEKGRIAPSVTMVGGISVYIS